MGILYGITDYYDGFAGKRSEAVFEKWKGAGAFGYGTEDKRRGAFCLFSKRPRMAGSNDWYANMETGYFAPEV